MISRILTLLFLFSFQTQTFTQTPDLIPIRVGDKFGFANSNFEMKIPPVYDNADLFDEFGRAIVEVWVNRRYGKNLQKNRHQGVIDTLGNFILQPYYSQLKKVPFRDKYLYKATQYFTKKAKPVGVLMANNYLLDFEGNLLLTGNTRSNFTIEDDYIILKGNSNLGSGVMTLELDTLLPRRYRADIKFRDGFIQAVDHPERGNKVHYFDASGRELFDKNYDRLLYLNEQRFLVSNKEKWQLFDTNEQSISKKFKLKKLQYFNEVSRFDRRTLTFKNGMMVVTRKGENKRFGYVNADGKLVIKPKYQDAKPFHPSGLACVKLNEKWGVIDRKGKTILPFEYEYLEILATNVFKIKEGKKSGAINQNGQPILPSEYFDIYALRNEEGLVGVTEFGQYLFDLEGNQLGQPYSQISRFAYLDQPLRRVQNGKRHGLIDKKGNEIFPLEYEGCTYCGEDIYLLKDDYQIYLAKSSGEIFFKDPIFLPVRGCYVKGNVIEIDKRDAHIYDGNLYFVDFQGNKFHIDQTPPTSIKPDFFIEGDTVFDVTRGFCICTDRIPVFGDNIYVIKTECRDTARLQNVVEGNSEIYNVRMVGKGAKHLEYEQKSKTQKDSLRLLERTWRTVKNRSFFDQMRTPGTLNFEVGDEIEFDQPEPNKFGDHYSFKDGLFNFQTNFGFQDRYYDIDFEGKWDFIDNQLIIQTSGYGKAGMQNNDTILWDKNYEYRLVFSLMKLNEEKMVLWVEAVENEGIE